MTYADQRWMGEHGIGRFARHVLAALDYRPVPLTSNPAAALDPLRLTRALGKLRREDLFYSPGYNSPLFCAAPFILTIHDLNHLDRPENRSLLKWLYYATLLKRAAHRAVRVLTVSEFSQGRIIEWAGVSPEKVLNVGNGVGPEFNPGVEPLDLQFPYLLCMSSRKRHKNEFRVVEAFARARFDGIKLVFPGTPTSELAACIQRNRVTGRVHFMGAIPAQQLPALYRGAEASVFVSLYEGFGLPVLESMASGIPVVTSNTSAMPEVAGDAALLVDPTSVAQIAAAMEQIVSDSSLRLRLRERGLKRAARYSWAHTVSRVQAALAQGHEERAHEKGMKTL